MKKKVLICVSDYTGIEVIKLLKNKYECTIFSTVKIKKLKQIIYIQDKKDFLKKLNNEIYFDWIICVYWPYLIPKKNFNLFGNSINFHPSYLPYCKGWYPNVIAKIYGYPYGVTLHKIANNIDGGNIWVQKKINISLLDDSKKIYDLAKKEILNLFKKNYKKILEKKIVSKKQKIMTKNFNKNAANKFNEIDINKKSKVKDLFNKILSRQFGNKTFAYFHHNKKKYSISLNIKEIK